MKYTLNVYPKIRRGLKPQPPGKISDRVKIYEDNDQEVLKSALNDRKTVSIDPLGQKHGKGNDLQGQKSPLVRTSTFTKKEKENLNTQAKQVCYLSSICVVLEPC